jgi:hypothetical protein
MTRLLLPLAVLALAACQQTVPLMEADAEARALTNACLSEIDQPALPEDADPDAAVSLTEAQQEAFSACVARAA